MRKMCGVWLLMAVCFFPVYTQAEEVNEIHGEWTNPLYEDRRAPVATMSALQENVLDENLAGLTADLEEAFLQRKETFTVDYSGDTADVVEKVQQAVKSVLSKNEYLNYDYQGYRFSGRGTSEKYVLSFTVNYFQTADQAAYVDQRVQQILNEIIDENMNTHEKVKAVYDYIILTTQYDTTYNQGVNAPYFALTEGKTLCNGYAMLVYRMLDNLDVPVRLISGSAGEIGHAWNLVQLDGEWYHLDATWDDPIPDEEGRLVYNYYMVTDDMMSKDHFWQEGGLNGLEQPYPAADMDYATTLSALGYDDLAESLNLHFLKAENTAKTEEEFVQLVSDHLNKIKESFSIRFVTDDVNIREKLSSLSREAAEQSDAESWRYSWVEYPRTEETDFIITFSNLNYAIEVEAIQMQLMPETTLKPGEESPFLVSATLSNGKRIDVTEQASYIVLDPTVASVHNGVLTAKNAGSTTINVSFQGQQTSFRIDVEAGPEEISYPMEGYKSFGEQQNVDADKIWTVEFNTNVNSSLSDSQVYVLNRFGEKGINFMELEGANKVKIHPPTGGYKAGETYYLMIEDSLFSEKGKKLKEAATLKFTISN